MSHTKLINLQACFYAQRYWVGSGKVQKGRQVEAFVAFFHVCLRVPNNFYALYGIRFMTGTRTKF